MTENPLTALAQELREQARAQMLNRIRTWCRDVRLDLASEAHWNALHPSEAPLKAIDPDGRLLGMVEDAERMLAADPGHGPIAPFTLAITTNVSTRPQ